MKILNFGSCNVDFIYSLNHLVGAGETENTGGLTVFPGGKGLNQSVAIAKAGAKVYHAGNIGSDGELLLQVLHENGVDTSFLHRVKEKNGHAIIQVSHEGENAVFIYPGSNEMVSKGQIDEVLFHFSMGDILLLQNEINNLDYLIACAHKKGMQIILNPSPYNERVSALDLTMLSYLILNEIEGCGITGSDDPDEILSFFKHHYPKLKVMLTLGRKGCMYQDEAQKIYYPAYQVTVVDNTAVYDTFTGYFVAGLAAGMEKKEILKIASCASALTSSKSGAATSIPNIGEVLRQADILPVSDSYNKTEKIRIKTEKYVESHMINASLEELAADLGYSTVYTGHLIKKITGKTFKKFLQDKRVFRAAKMLRETDLPIGEIIQGVGYENESFFREIFKKQYGKNPLEYRRDIREERK